MGEAVETNLLKYPSQDSIGARCFVQYFMSLFFQWFQSFTHEYYYASMDDSFFKTMNCNFLFFLPMELRKMLIPLTDV